MASAVAAAAASATASDPRRAVREVAPLDPLKLDIDDEEMEYEPDRLNRELEVSPIPTLPLETI